MTNAADTEEVFERIYHNYNHMNQMMVEEMELASRHDGLTGNYREEMWMKFFRSILPHKFSLAQGVMVIDSEKRVSKEVDIAVFDEQYTPYVFQYNTLKFIPIEAVVMVIECKSTSPDIGGLREWAKAMDRLEAKPSGMARIVQGYATGITNFTQQRTCPIKVLACTKQSATEQPLLSIQEDLKDHFDFMIQKKRDGTDRRFEVLIPNADKTLQWWGDRLNRGIRNNQESGGLPLQFITKELAGSTQSPELKFDDNLRLTNTLQDLKIHDNPLLSLNLQLNQLLMLINNPMLFPHFAYARAFNEIAHRKGGS